MQLLPRFPRAHWKPPKTSIMFLGINFIMQQHQFSQDGHSIICVFKLSPLCVMMSLAACTPFLYLIYLKSFSSRSPGHRNGQLISDKAKHISNPNRVSHFSHVHILKYNWKRSTHLSTVERTQSQTNRDDLLVYSHQWKRDQPSAFPLRYKTSA